MLVNRSLSEVAEHTLYHRFGLKWDTLTLKISLNRDLHAPRHSCH